MTFDWHAFDYVSSTRLLILRWFNGTRLENWHHPFVGSERFAFSFRRFPRDLVQICAVFGRKLGTRRPSRLKKKIILLLSHQKFPSFDITKGCLKKCHVIEKIRDQYPFKKPNKIRDGDFPAFSKNNIMKELIMRMGIAWRSSEAQTTQTNGLNNQRLTEPDAL